MTKLNTTLLKDLPIKQTSITDNDYVVVSSGGTKKLKIKDITKDVEKKAANLEEKTTELSEQLDNKAKQVDLEVERARINNLAKLGEGSTTGDAELLDGRVMFDGTTATNIGEAIRTQMKDVNDNFTSNNLFTLNKNKIVDNKFVTDQEQDNDNYIYFKHIPVKANEEYIIEPVARYVSFYNSEKTFLSKIDNSKNFTATEDGYVSISIYKPYVNEDMKLYKSGEKNVLKYLTYSFSDNINMGTLEDIKKMVVLSSTTQLFDRSTIKTGYMSVSGYVDSGNTNYVHTEKIDVSGHEGDTIYFSIDGTSSNFRYVTAYDSSDNCVKDSGIIIESSSYTIPIGISKIVISYKNPTKYTSYNHFQAEFNRITDYVDYGKKISFDYTIIKSDVDGSIANKNILNGKKWAVCGDSFSNGDFANALDNDYIITEGRYKGKNKVYGYLIGNRNNMNIQHLAVGGQTMATPSDGSFLNCFSNNIYKTIDSDVDYITLYLGINDSHHRPNSTGTDGEDTSGIIELGTISDMTINTFYGAWNVVMQYLIEKHPFAHIGIIVSNGCETDEYRMATIDIAKKWGVPYIDLNGDERTPMMLRSTNPNISSDVKLARNKAMAVNWGINGHPSAKTHEYESYFIENFLRSL